MVGINLLIRHVFISPAWLWAIINSCGTAKFSQGTTSLNVGCKSLVGWHKIWHWQLTFWHVWVGAYYKHWLNKLQTIICSQSGFSWSKRQATNLQLQCLYLSNIMHKIFDETSQAAICKVCQFGRLALLGNTVSDCCRCDQPIADFPDHTATNSGSPAGYMMTSSW